MFRAAAEVPVPAPPAPGTPYTEITIKRFGEEPVTYRLPADATFYAFMENLPEPQALPPRHLTLLK